MITRYRQWKRMLINCAIERHQRSLGEVEALNDATLLSLYDLILGALTGPKTIRLRQSPSLAGAIRIFRAERSFARHLYHQKKLVDLAK